MYESPSVEAVFDPDHREVYREWKAQSGAIARTGKEPTVGKPEHWEHRGSCIEVLVIGTATNRFGHLCVVGANPLEEGEFILAERASNICAIHLFQERLLMKEARLHLAGFP